MEKRVVTGEILVSDLRALGLGPGDWVAVHSSLKSIGWVEGGPETVIRALIEAVEPRGTVIMPSFILPRDEPWKLTEAPTHLGLLPETFRKFPGVQRSHHPTHSVAIHGPRAGEVARAHRDATFIGRGSPYDHLEKNNGWVLHIGVDFTTSSIIHLAEVYAGLPYLDVAYPAWARRLEAEAPDGSTVVAEPREVPADSKKFILVQEEMDRRDMLVKGMVGNAPCVMARAADMLEVAAGMMKRDPALFLCDYPYCPVCRESEKILEELADCDSENGRK